MYDLKSATGDKNTQTVILVIMGGKKTSGKAKRASFLCMYSVTELVCDSQVTMREIQVMILGKVSVF